MFYKNNNQNNYFFELFIGSKCNYIKLKLADERLTTLN